MCSLWGRGFLYGGLCHGCLVESSVWISAAFSLGGSGECLNGVGGCSLMLFQTGSVAVATAKSTIGS